MVREWMDAVGWMLVPFFLGGNVGQQKLLGDKNKWGGGKGKETHTQSQ